MKNNKLYLGVFIAVSILYVIGIVLNNEILKFVFKPLIMISLLAYYLSLVNKKHSLYIGAVIFSFLGDVFLLFDGELNFMFGLVSFLIAHLFFIWMVVKQLKKSAINKKIIASVPFVISFSALLSLLKDSLGEMLIPVVVYGMVISVFGAVALLNNLIFKSKSSLYLFSGAVSFVVSDSLLALNKFYQPQEYYPVIVIITYMVAQYLICKSVIENSEK